MFCYPFGKLCQIVSTPKTTKASSEQNFERCGSSAMQKKQPHAQHHLRLSSKENDILNPAIPFSWTAALPDPIKWGKEVKILTKNHNTKSLLRIRCIKAEQTVSSLGWHKYGRLQNLSLFLEISDSWASVLCARPHGHGVARLVED